MRYIPFTIELIHDLSWEQVYCNLMYGKFTFDIAKELDLNLINQEYIKEL